MKIIIDMNTDNAAFTDDYYAEVSRILRVAVDQIEDCFSAGRCIDHNGNHVGDWEVERDT